MRKFKKIFISVMALAIVSGFSLTVFAAPSANGQLDGRATHGRVTINSSGATGQTNISALPAESTTNVHLSYVYMDKETNQNITIRNSGFGTNAANTSLSRPTGSDYRSIRAFADHTARYAGQTWTASTDIFY